MSRSIPTIAAAIAAAMVLAAPASAAGTSAATPSPTLSVKAKITSFRATSAGVVANGTLTGRLRSGTTVSRDSAPVRFSVAASRRGRQCNVLNLRLAPLFLELLGVRVTTSHISLDVTARQGRVLGNLFCALARAKVRFPRIARAMNARLGDRSLPVFAASTRVHAAQAQESSCQILKLVLGPLHLDLLGLVVDLYGKTRSDPVVVTINGLPGKGLLGDLLCGLAGGSGTTSLAGLKSLLSSLGVSLNDAQLQNLVSSLGLNLAAGLSNLDIQRVLQALGLGSTLPPG
jgi:hypothetical protein